MKPGDLVVLPDSKLGVFIKSRGRNHSLILYQDRLICMHNEWFRSLDETG